MIKKTLYGKTPRYNGENAVARVTEKLDGSNIGFFKLNGELLIAQRNNVLQLSELEEVKDKLYNGLYQWLLDNGEELKDSLHEESGFFGEWIGMGQIKYPDLDKRVYIFAKANINEELEVRNVYYDSELLLYPFIDEDVPEFVGFVPFVEIFEAYPCIEELDLLYAVYCNTVDRPVEGFVVCYRNAIKKYVRYKRGKLEDHME